ncbi:hypothetical protein LJC63_04525 [Ruminococcaceae bacterium OttesenSCG-928-L11]|nr:hypothetical protein [Ruminococcaceae bacterium OttesenSCG-928-L11]
MNDGESRTGIGIITDLFNLTNKMIRQLDDPDFLIESVNQRQVLMDEYDAWRGSNSNSPEEQDAIKGMIKEIVAMDQKINTTLTYHRNEAKKNLSENQNQQKVAGYGNIGGLPGNHMNYSK